MAYDQGRYSRKSSIPKKDMQVAMVFDPVVPLLLSIGDQVRGLRPCLHGGRRWTSDDQVGRGRRATGDG